MINPEKITMMILLGMVLAGIFPAGCIGPAQGKVPGNLQTTIPDPETGIAAWIMAVNDRDYGAVYDLLPVSKQAGISRSAFIRMNRETPSPFLASGPVITGYYIVNTTSEGRNVSFFTGLQTTRISSESNGTLVNQTVFFTFDETYEDNSWKVWTR
jgi:hypothetical protein